MKCNCCQLEKEEYLNELCKECSDKMDNHIIKRLKEEIDSNKVSVWSNVHKIIDKIAGEKDEVKHIK